MEKKTDDTITASELLVMYPDLLLEVEDDVGKIDLLDDAYIEHRLRTEGWGAIAFNKFSALRNIIYSNRYWFNLPDTLTLANGVTYGIAYVGALPLANMEALGWSIVEAVLWEQDLTLAKFSDNIKAYIYSLAEYTQEFAITLSNFVDNEKVKEFDSPQLNTWLIVKTKDMLSSIAKIMRAKNNPINLNSLKDIKMKLEVLFNAKPENLELLINGS